MRGSSTTIHRGSGRSSSGCRSARRSASDSGPRARGRGPGGSPAAVTAGDPPTVSVMALTPGQPRVCSSERVRSTRSPPCRTRSCTCDATSAARSWTCWPIPAAVVLRSCAVERAWSAISPAASPARSCARSRSDFAHPKDLVVPLAAGARAQHVRPGADDHDAEQRTTPANLHGLRPRTEQVAQLLALAALVVELRPQLRDFTTEPDVVPVQVAQARLGHPRAHPAGKPHRSCRSSFLPPRSVTIGRPRVVPPTQEPAGLCRIPAVDAWVHRGYGIGPERRDRAHERRWLFRLGVGAGLGAGPGLDRSARPGA